MIIGGKQDLRIRKRQLEEAYLRAIAPTAGRQRLNAFRSRVACFVAQFDEIPVQNNHKTIAYIKGAYLATLFKKTNWIGAIFHMHKVFREWTVTKERIGAKAYKTPTVSFKFIKQLESSRDDSNSRSK